MAHPARNVRGVGRLAFGAVLAAALSVAGCGDGASDTHAAAVSHDGSTVRAIDFAFAPNEVQISPGSAVTWTNAGAEIHNIKGRGFFSGGLAPGSSYEHRFAEPGRYRYLCTLHPTAMRGMIAVAPQEQR